MKDIVVAVDFSKSSVQALKYALKIAAKTSSDLKLVYVSKKRDVQVEIFDEKKGEFINIQKNLKEMIDTHQPTIPGKITSKVLHGKIYEEITNQAKYTDSWMIIAGAHGMSGYEDEWIGNNALKIITHAATPVLIVKKSFDQRNPIDKIVLPIDSSNETLQKLPVTIELAKKHKAQINILCLLNSYLGEFAEQTKSLAKDALKQVSKTGLRYFSDEISCTNNSEAILEYALVKEADLISIMTDQESTNPGALTFGFAEEIINHSPIPVLTVKTQKLKSTSNR
jgi:nucleotide-binding universal stress UspA family protein